MRLNKWTLPVLLGALLIQGSVMTASAVDTPTSSLPGAIINDKQTPYTDQKGITESDKTFEQNPEASTVTNQVQKPKIDPSLEKPVQIDHFDMQGFTKLTQAEIDAIIKPYEGKSSSIQDIQDNVVDALTALYEKKGYITSLVFLPPQKIDGGVLIIKADEGVISELTLEKGKYFGPRAVMPRLAMHKGKIFQLQDLEKSLRRINENPDLTLDATLKAGEKPGETKVILRPQKDNFPVHISAFYDNLGRHPIGRQRLGVTINDNNVTGLGDTAYVSPYATTHSFGLLGGYEIPLGSRGLRLGVSAAHTQFDVPIAGQQFKGNSNIFQPYIIQELFRNEKSVLSAELGLGIKNSTFEADNARISHDKLTVLSPALSYKRYDKSGQWFARNEVGIGLDILGANAASDITSSRLKSGSQFFRDTLTLARIQKLAWGTYGIFRFTGQYSPDSLVSLEQMQLGGASTVRGYREGRLIGDSGFVLSAEWHVPMKFLPKTWHVGSYNLRENLELVGFTDFGGVFDNNARQVGGVNVASGKTRAGAIALGTGFGVRGRISKRLNFRVDAGFPLLFQSPDNNTARIHFGLESRIF